METENSIKELQAEFNALKDIIFVFFNEDYSRFENESKLLLQKIIHQKANVDANSEHYLHLSQLERDLRVLNEETTNKKLRQSTNAKKPRKR